MTETGALTNRADEVTVLAHEIAEKDGKNYCGQASANEALPVEWDRGGGK